MIQKLLLHLSRVLYLIGPIPLVHEGQNVFVLLKKLQNLRSNHLGNPTHPDLLPKFFLSNSGEKFFVILSDSLARSA
jgi:hypothetical protein